MELSNILSIIALALGSGLAAGRFLWAGDRRSNRDRLMSAEAEAARLNERVAVLIRLAEERAAAITVLEGKLDAAIKQANEAAFEGVRLRERENALNRQLETQTRHSAGMEQQLTAEFENLANRILKANAAELSDNSQRTMAALLESHSDGTVINRIGITVTGIKKIKSFFCKIQPAVGVKMFGIVAANHALEIALPGRDHFMKRFCCRRKIIGLIISLFVKIYMYLWQPLVVFQHALLRFNLRLPGPIPVQIEIVMIGAAAGPGLHMLSCYRVGIGCFPLHLVFPINITITPIRVNTGIQYDHDVFQPLFCFAIGGINQFI